MVNWVTLDRRARRKKRKKQKKINSQLKKRLFGDLAFAPCYYCRIVFLHDELTIEHIIPLCLGGTNDESNITLACAPCNHQRGKIAWRQKQSSQDYLAIKQQRAREHYEQYSPEYHQQNREGTVQISQSSIDHYQRENL